MRDAQSKLDQVIAFTGKTVTVDDVSTVLGLVGRDLLLDAVQAVADEDATAAFRLAGLAVEMGYDLRLVCRELTRVVRDLLVLNVDPSRISDPEIAAEGERERLTSLVARFSREDLLRAFDLLARAEVDLRSAAQPRYHLEMVLLRWIHLRKLLPIEDLIAGAASAAPRAPVPAPSPTRSASSSPGSGAGRVRPKAVAASSPGPSAARTAAPPFAIGSASSPVASIQDSGLKDALLAEIRKAKVVFYQTVVAQAQRIDVNGDSVTFTFSPAQRALRDMFEPQRPWLESTAQSIAGRKIVVTAAQAQGPPEPAAEPSTATSTDRKLALREQALADPGVQALLEVLPAEIRDVEEM
jgi:DNA polymerase-3 subunit gamma/tau